MAISNELYKHTGFGLLWSASCKPAAAATIANVLLTHLLQSYSDYGMQVEHKFTFALQPLDFPFSLIKTIKINMQKAL